MSPKKHETIQHLDYFFGLYGFIWQDHKTSL